jgi:hypothetical protein
MSFSLFVAVNGLFLSENDRQFVNIDDHVVTSLRNDEVSIAVVALAGHER